MNATEILTTLEHERELLREFYRMSELQLLLLDNEDLDGVNQLMDQRTDLMLELTAVEATLETWIEQIRNDPKVTSEILTELQSSNEDIVTMAARVVEIDEQIHWRLDLIKSRTGSELRSLNTGSQALRGYERACLS